MNIEKLEDLQQYTEKEIQDILGGQATSILKKQLHKMGIIFKNERPEVLLGIEVLGLSVRTYNAVVQSYSTLGSLLGTTEKALRSVRGLGIKSRTELIEQVHACGLKFDYEKKEEESFYYDPSKYLSLKVRKEYLVKELNRVNEELEQLENMPKQYIK